MAAGFGLLGLSPKTFWSMTPRELDSAIGVLAPARSGAMGRDDLAALMRAFPDRVC
jgi:uncharacterized phage protein (TIGR02216 family)